MGNNAGRSYRAAVVNTQTGSMLLDMTKSVNACHLTTMNSRGLFLPVLLLGFKMYAKYNPGSNVTIILYILARELGIPIKPFQATFRQAAGAKGVC